LDIKVCERIAEGLSHEGLAKNQINVVFKPEIDCAILSFDYPRLFQILSKVSTYFGIRPSHMLIYLKGKTPMKRFI